MNSFGRMKARRNVRQTIVPLKGGRSLIASFSLARHTSRVWAVFLPQSGCDFQYADRSELASLVGLRAARDLNFLVINKPGLEPDRVDKVAFEKSFRRERRIEDALRALNVVVPKGNKIHLIGYSEGAYLAPQIAHLDSRVVSVTMIGGGTRGWLKEELNNANRREKPVFARKIKEIYADPSSIRKWNGFSFATWYSYRGDSTLRALRNLNVPTLAVLGARDRVIDFKSTINDLKLIGEKKKIEVHVFDNCGHQFTKHWDPVSRVLGRFLSDRKVDRTALNV